MAKDRWPRLTPCLVCLLFFVSGHLAASLALSPRLGPDNIANLARTGREASLLGVLTRAPAIGPERTTLLMNTQAMLDGQDWRPSQGLIQLVLPGPPPPGLVPGDLFLVRAVIGPVPGYGVPGAFNYQEYLASQGIRASGFIRSQALIAKVNRLPAPSLAGRLRFLPERIRYRLSRFLTRTLPQPVAGVYQAILLGEMANLPPEVMEDFKASGSVHILSISGLHMALVALVSTLLVSFLLRRSTWVLLNLPAPKIAALLSLFPLVLYALIAGFNPPVVRSLVMVAIFIVALLVDRQWSLVNNLALAALILLATNPLLLFTASFQLTFGAVLAISVFAPAGAKIIGWLPVPEPDSPLLVRLWCQLRKWGLASILASLAATLGTAPILAWQFNRIPLVSPLATLLVEPFLCLWALFLGLIACLLTGLPALAQPLFALGGLGIRVSLALAHLCARLPASSIWVPTPGLSLTGAWVVGLLLLARWGRLSRRAIGLGAVLITLLGLAGIWPATKPDRFDTRLAVLDVGQGSAMIVDLPDGQVFLIDGGRKPSPASAGFDVGENLIAPFLWRRGITRLSAVICSHPDADHFNGIPFILRHFRPETLWINGSEHRENGYQEMLDLAAGLKVRVRIPVPGETLGEARGTSLISLTGRRAGAPPPGAGSAASVNNQSLVLRLSRGRVRMLMPSDIERQEEETLLADPRLASAVLVAPHHGSDSSSSEGFVGAVRPQLVAISAGRNQSGHFPAPEVLRRYQGIGSQVLETAEHGSIFFATDGVEVKTETYR